MGVFKCWWWFGPGWKYMKLNIMNIRLGCPWILGANPWSGCKAPQMFPNSFTFFLLIVSSLAVSTLLCPSGPSFSGWYTIQICLLTVFWNGLCLFLLSQLPSFQCHIKINIRNIHIEMSVTSRAWRCQPFVSVTFTFLKDWLGDSCDLVHCFPRGLPIKLALRRNVSWRTLTWELGEVLNLAQPSSRFTVHKSM